jgi:hypothetical protein
MLSETLQKFFRNIPVSTLKPILVVYAILLVLVIINGVVMSQFILRARRSSAIEMLAKKGWVKTSGEPLTPITSKFVSSEILFSNSTVTISSILFYKKNDMWLWFGDETHTGSGKSVIVGATIAYLVVPLENGFSEAVFLGSFGSILRKAYYKRLGYKKTSDLEGYVDVLSKTRSIDDKTLAIAKSLQKVSLVRSNANKKPVLNLDENPDIEFYPFGIVVRFVGPLNAEFIESLDTALSEI